MDLNKMFEILDSFFGYKIEMLGNKDGYIVQIWDGYGLRRANVHEGTLESAIKKSLEQYKEDKEN